MRVFNQLLQHFPRLEFAALVKQHGAGPNICVRPMNPSGGYGLAGRTRGWNGPDALKLPPYPCLPGPWLHPMSPAER